MCVINAYTRTEIGEFYVFHESLPVCYCIATTHGHSPAHQVLHFLHTKTIVPELKTPITCPVVVKV
jgi:hypothetical protein